MRRTRGICALLVLAAMTTACGFDIFEDIGSDPHPPTVQITALTHYVAENTASTAKKTDVSPQGRSITFDSGGFTLSFGQQFYIGRYYTDAGGDILKFHLRDRDGSTTKDLTPTANTYFPGTSGTLPEMIIDPVTNESTVPAKELIDLTGIFGRHRLEFWAEDSHGSRSEKVEFIITLVP
jgi:hypothetical protein